jgi:DNA-binding XRE family transcriptional regulator
MEDRVKSRAEQVVAIRTGRDVPEFLRELYVDQGLSQQEVAERLGVHRLTVVGWMRDFGIPTRDRRALANREAIA